MILIQNALLFQARMDEQHALLRRSFEQNQRAGPLSRKNFDNSVAPSERSAS